MATDAGTASGTDLDFGDERKEISEGSRGFRRDDPVTTDIGIRSGDFGILGFGDQEMEGA